MEFDFGLVSFADSIHPVRNCKQLLCASNCIEIAIIIPSLADSWYQFVSNKLLQFVQL